MNNGPNILNIRPRILYKIAKAAWEGQLAEKREEICQLVYNEYKDQASRRQVVNQIRTAMGLEPHDLDSIINEHDQEAFMGITDTGPVITDAEACRNCFRNTDCEKSCLSGALKHDISGALTIDKTLCLGDGHCIQTCSFGALAEKSQFVPLINMLREKKQPVYASVAPAFAGQFGAKVTAGKLRTALLQLGFEEMVETALYADLITMKEAFEFDEYVKQQSDFMITSCCCPVWIKLIENKYPNLANHISPSVSPMVASARVIKALHPEAKVVFIGPCIAKKTEAILPDLAGAVDFVLTFQELATIFAAANIIPAEQPDNENSQASWAGRVYARTGGVSEAVGTTADKLIPKRAQSFRPVAVDGIPDCTKVLNDLVTGKLTANFIEGMACKGGCVGGPGKIISPEQGTARVNDYSIIAKSQTPVENPNIYAILMQLENNQDIPIMTGKSPMSQLLARKHEDKINK